MKINWKQKLSSRKFWLAAGSMVVTIMGAFGISESVIANILKILVGLVNVMVYITKQADIDYRQLTFDERIEKHKLNLAHELIKDDDNILADDCNECDNCFDCRREDERDGEDNV